MRAAVAPPPKRKFGRTLSGLDDSGALANFERMEDKVDEQEARAAALGELESTSLEQRFAELETASRSSASSPN